MPTFIYAAEPSANVAYEVDGSSYAPQTASSGGTVALSVAVPLAEGHHTIRAKATDAAGNAEPVERVDRLRRRLDRAGPTSTC